MKHLKLVSSKKSEKNCFVQFSRKVFFQRKTCFGKMFSGKVNNFEKLKELEERNKELEERMKLQQSQNFEYEKMKKDLEKK